MKICIMQSLPDKAKIKLEKDAPNLFPKMKLAEFSKIFNISIKNASRYRNGTRAIPLRLFESLIKFSKKDLSEFQNKINIKINKTGSYLKIGPHLDISEEWIYISQLINGDGHITSNFWYINFVNNNQMLIDYVHNFFRKIGVGEQHFSMIKRPDAMFLIVRSSLLAILLNRILDVNIGKKEEIRIPDFVINKKEFSIAAIRGAFDAEGSVTFAGTRRISITSNSKIWINNLHVMLNNLKIKSRIFKEEKNRDKPIYRLLISHIVNINKFNSIIRPLHSKKKLKLVQIIKNFNKNFNGHYNKEILLNIKKGFCRKRDIAKKINQSLIITNNNLSWLKKNKLIYPQKKIFSNKGSYFLYTLTKKGEDFLRKESNSFFD